MLRSAILILSGNAATALLLLIRNLIVARLIPVADYGVAATFAIAMAVVEMTSALGLQQQIVQARNGEDPRFQAALQGFQVLRGTIAAVALFGLAGPIAAFMAVPEAVWAYRVLAVVPLLNALVHFDIYRANRTMVFLPVILTGAVPALLSTLVIWPLFAWYGDYRVMLYAIVLQAGLTVITSQLLATRPYRLLLDRTIMADSLRFGWPILANAVLLFLVFNGDKVIVGRALGMATLAIFAMGFTLTLTPMLVLEKSAQAFFLPQLTALTAAADRPRFVQVAMATAQAHLAFGAALVVGVVVIGAPVVHLLLGPKYAALLPLLTWLAILQAARVFKGVSSPMALARAQTEVSMYASLPRVAALPLAAYIAGTTGNIVLVIQLAILAELVGFALTLWLLRARLDLPLDPLVWPVLTCLALLIGAAVLPDRIAMPVTAGLFVLALVSMQDLRRYVLGQWHRV